MRLAGTLPGDAIQDQAWGCSGNPIFCEGRWGAFFVETATMARIGRSHFRLATKRHRSQSSFIGCPQVYDDFKPRHDLMEPKTASSNQRNR